MGRKCYLSDYIIQNSTIWSRLYNPDCTKYRKLKQKSWAEVKVTQFSKNIREEYPIMAIERCLLYEASGQPRTRTSTSSSECDFHPNGGRCRSWSSNQSYTHTI